MNKYAFLIFVFLAGCAHNGNRLAETDASFFVEKDKTTLRRELFCGLCAPPAPPPFLEKIADRPEDERKLFNFALSLMRDKQLYRAITELYRFASYYPSSPLAPEAYLLAGECYFLAGKWRFAEKDYTRARNALTGGEYLFADLRIAAAAYFQQDFETAQKRAKEILEAQRPEFREAARYLLYLSSVSSGDLNGAATEMAALKKEFPESALVKSFDTTADGLLEGESLPGRSPLAGGIMSAAVPGLGQAYSGRYADAASALLMTAGLGFASYKCFEDDAEVPGYVIGALTISFYFANIYNGAKAARKFNDDVIQNFYKDVRRGSFFDHLILAPDEKGGVFGGLGYTF
jgi:tetratricopeptide (TPR) repeat protein